MLKYFPFRSKDFASMLNVVLEITNVHRLNIIDVKVMTITFLDLGLDTQFIIY